MSEEEKPKKGKLMSAQGGYMPDEKKGYQPLKKGYQPVGVSGAEFTPPQGGSGVPKKIKKKEE